MSPLSASATRILVLGLGDVGSAVAHRLFSDGHPVVIHGEPAPTTTRRHMAFADAAFDGWAKLIGVEARRVHDLAGVQRLLRSRLAIPVSLVAWGPLLHAFAPQVLVDARMRKHQQPDILRGFAPLTIGLGPGFEVGRHCDIAVETSWSNLGAVIHHGAPLALAGEPRVLGGYGHERYVYAPVEGVWRTRFRIGDAVMSGQEIGIVSHTALDAPMDGVIRGLTRDGVSVRVRTKLVEVDPRGTPDVSGIAERPRRIGEGVAAAIDSEEGQRLLAQGAP